MPALTKNRAHVLPGGLVCNFFMFWQPFFFFSSPRAESTKSRVARMDHWLFLVHMFVKMSPVHLQEAIPASFWVVSYKAGEKSSNRLLESSFTLFFSVSAVDPLQSGHLLPFGFSAAETLNLCSLWGTAGSQTSLAHPRSYLKNKIRGLSCQLWKIRRLHIKVLTVRDISGDPMLETPCSHYKGHWFQPWLGN